MKQESQRVPPPLQRTTSCHQSRNCPSRAAGFPQRKRLQLPANDSSKNSHSHLRRLKAKIEMASFLTINDHHESSTL